MKNKIVFFCIMFTIVFCSTKSFSTDIADSSNVILGPVKLYRDGGIPTSNIVQPSINNSVQPGIQPATDYSPKTIVSEKQSWWEHLLSVLVEGIATIIVSVLSVLLMSLINKFRLKIEQQKVDWILEKSIGYGEQKLKIILKEGKGVKDPESIKQQAIIHGENLLKKYGLFKKFGDWLAEGVEAKLGQKVLDNGGASSKKETK